MLIPEDVKSPFCKKRSTRRCRCERKTQHRSGAGILNNFINNLPFELHAPGYNFCGPGTRLRERLLRGDKGVNPLDEACKRHDIAYHNNPTSLQERHRADLELAAAAESRLRDPNTPLGERLTSLAVNKIMKFKVKRGMGISFAQVVKHSRKAIRGKGKNASHNDLLKAAVRAARKIARGRIVKTPRVIPIPKSGGFLPLIPLLGALAAAGSLAGGVTTAAKNIYEMVKKSKSEGGRSSSSSSSSEKIVGKGLYMHPYKKGMGLYLTPYSSKN